MSPTDTPQEQPSFNTLHYRKYAKRPSNVETMLPELHKLIKPHIDSFDAIKECNNGKSPGLLAMSIADMDHQKITDGCGNVIEFYIESVQIAQPRITDANTRATDKRLMPTECRERGITYEGRMSCRIAFSVNNGPRSYVDNKQLGNLPLMVKSKYCHLHGMSPAKLVQHCEEAEELGGYFIVNGLEKLIRLLIVNRRNHPMAIIRPSFQKRGNTYTQFGVMIRCVRADQTSHTNTIHYLTDGSATFRFSYRKQEYMVPVVMVLKALIDTSDREIYESIIQEATDNTFLTDRIEMMVRSFKTYSLYTREQCLAFIGSKFRVALDLWDGLTDIEVGEYFIRKLVLVHLQDATDKFNLLIFMIQKLYGLVAGDCAADNPDSVQHQEVLLGGFLFNMILKEKLEDYMVLVKSVFKQELRRFPTKDLSNSREITKFIQKGGNTVGRALEFFLATGNLISNTGLDLQQASGYTIIAEKLNYYRYIAHFRSIHRGAFFAELKTTAVRKLMPESWGFLCPVHTPDGSPCGLLNHLAHMCKLVTDIIDVSGLPAVCGALGMKPIKRGDYTGIPRKSSVKILLDGRVIGYCKPEELTELVAKLRYLKVTKGAGGGVPIDVELGHVPVSHGGQYPGLFLFSQPARMIRPVKYLATGQIDMVGSFEQVFMDVACLEEDIAPGATTHQETAPTNMLSVIANLTPFSDFNQSPRNMYQCQMGKQSMGTPLHAFPNRTDNKLYRLITGQTPVVRPILHDQYGVDNYPNGMNAIVAVISYTGYDMEDAMILNKMSYERGFGHGVILKTEFADLGEMRERGEPILHHFGCTDLKKIGCGKLDHDGLPNIGVQITNGDPLYSYINDTTGICKAVKYKGLEDAIIDDVRLLGAESGDVEAQKIAITYRIPRNPIIGDKFSSRHGQKGVCSQRYPIENLPFTESGMTPDVIINPHAFPSRMTIGMFVESMAGKAGALHGIVQDSTPFTFTEEDKAVDFFGKQLKDAGYNYYGNEPMYSGITGEELHVDIYIGVVYYQRLRHMVSDKYQVRTTGPIDNLTHQPVKGRKRAGGIRFGEMERDSLLAHGVSFCLQDRLMNCSDYSIAHVCVTCGNILSPYSVPTTLPSSESQGALSIVSGKASVECKLCESKKNITAIAIPYVFRYLATELMAMNIKMKLDIN